MTTMPPTLQDGYYRIPNGTVVKLNYIGRDQEALVLDENNTLQKISLETLQEATFLPHHRPTPKQLWDQSHQLQNEKWNRTNQEETDFTRKFNQKIEFIKWLLEFNYIEVETLGYFGGNKYRRQAMQEGQDGLMDTLSYNIVRVLNYFEEGNDTGIETWAKNPCPETLHTFAPRGLKIQSDYTCQVTDQKITWHFDGKTITATEYWDGSTGKFKKLEPFPYPDHKLPPSSYTIEIPSGKLALFQWVPNITVEPNGPDEDYNVNTQKGRIEYSQHYEKQNIWHIFVGNRPRKLYTDGESWRIGHTPEDSEPPAIWKGWTEIGKISFETGLRWITGCDATKLKPESYQQDHILVIDVPPGKYRLTDHVENGKEETLFASFQKIECTPN